MHVKAYKYRNANFDNEKDDKHKHIDINDSYNNTITSATAMVKIITFRLQCPS